MKITSTGEVLEPRRPFIQRCPTCGTELEGGFLAIAASGWAWLFGNSGFSFWNRTSPGCSFRPYASERAEELAVPYNESREACRCTECRVLFVKLSDPE